LKTFSRFHNRAQMKKSSFCDTSCSEDTLNSLYIAYHRVFNFEIFKKEPWKDKIHIPFQMSHSKRDLMIRIFLPVMISGLISRFSPEGKIKWVRAEYFYLRGGIRGGILPREASQFRTGTIESGRNQYDRPGHLRAFDVGSRMAICENNCQRILIVSCPCRPHPQSQLFLDSAVLKIFYWGLIVFQSKANNTEGRLNYYRSKKFFFSHSRSWLNRQKTKKSCYYARSIIIDTLYHVMDTFLSAIFPRNGPSIFPHHDSPSNLAESRYS